MNEKHVLRNEKEITIKECTVEHIEALQALQIEVIQSLTIDSFLQPLSKEEFSHIVTGNGLMIGAFHEEDLVAFRALLIPDENEEDHLGEDAGLEKEEWRSVIYSEVSNVKPSFRGNGLQKLLGKIIFNKIDQEKHRYICATVAPFNIASLLDKFAHDLQIVALKEKYDDMLRYVFMKDLQQEERHATDRILIDMADTKKQQALLAEGWIGTSMQKVDEEWTIAYEKYE
ncbi:GNAT family N-acetyltransferase [Sporosarcina pasteurii]|uniref:N-acetyltransferase domain-containing protein n=1 Tax=Sporosarcina pasteurii TaxID=1474 RepID=A0A380C8Q5_SPOPA|nr:GNAT family N-acetyltransferase [Sporosarcina pasteurii]MDS9473010.1 GNAT family N-acetyltransferase [Sporosarcina pasteurii]QBQ04519.1 GNAT family N-acetyltransferase [Sporosarcina pasteurii]SUJ14275.1 Uncharacterised protein [Sporosarcina pasteurii]